MSLYYEFKLANFLDWISTTLTTFSKKSGIVPKVFIVQLLVVGVIFDIFVISSYDCLAAPLFSNYIVHAGLYNQLHLRYYVHIMSLSENTNIEREALLIQVNLYKQMREQLLAKIKLYQLQNKVELAKIISESI